MTRSEIQAGNRAKIVKAAAEIFEAHGYEAATLRQIAAHAGLSTGAIFSSFDGKEAVYEAVTGLRPMTNEQGQAALAAIREIDGCFSAAYTEGLHDRITELPYELGNIRDLLERRVLHAHIAARTYLLGDENA